jgi:cellulose synthase (UDP-forming)
MASPLLPTGPSREERLLYADPRNRLLLLWQIVAWTGLSLSLLLFSFNSPWLAPFTVWVVLGGIYFGLSFAANTSFRRFDVAAHDALVAAHRRRPQPAVDVLLPNCGESLAVLENAFGHIARLDHPGPLRVLCLDDRGRPEVAELAARFGFDYFARPDRGRFKKAGNLRHGYLRSRGEFIAIFDADFCPAPDFLAELLPYMDDPTTAIVQSPQWFRTDPGRSWLENGAAGVQEFFYRWVLPGRDRRRSPICVGTNAIYRRTALQTTNGGALVENSEDVHTGFDLMAKGFRTKYVPVILAEGLCPDTLAAFFNQQHRWCSGSMSLLFSRKFWREPIGLRPRLTFLSGMAYYVYTGFAVLLMPLPSILMVLFFPEAVFWWNYALLLPSMVQSYVFLPRWHRQPYGFDVLRTKLVYSWAHLFAFADRARGARLPWNATGGEAAGRAGLDRITVLRICLVGWPVLALGLVLTGCALHMDGVLDVNYWPMLVFAVGHAFSAVCVLRPLRRATVATDDAAVPVDSAQSSIVTSVPIGV